MDSFLTVGWFIRLSQMESNLVFLSVRGPLSVDETLIVSVRVSFDVYTHTQTELSVCLCFVTAPVLP